MIIGIEDLDDEIQGNENQENDMPDDLRRAKMYLNASMARRGDGQIIRFIQALCTEIQV